MGKNRFAGRTGQAGQRMQVDWSLVSEIAKPLLGAVAVLILTRIFQQRAKVISYFLHSNAIQMPGTEGRAPYIVHVHSVVVRNVGKKAATNIRVSHLRLPAYSVFPEVSVTREDLARGVVDLVFPILRPQEQITISYLYFPPIVWNQIHAGIKHDDGFAIQREVNLTNRLPIWQQRSIFAIFLVGVFTLLYVSLNFAQWMWTRIQ